MPEGKPNPFKDAIQGVRPVADVAPKEERLVLNSHQPASLVTKLKYLAASSRRSQTDLISEGIRDLLEKYGR